MNETATAEPAAETRGAALLAEMRARPYREWLESRPPIIITTLAIALGLPLGRRFGKMASRPYTKAELIDRILAAEWRRTAQ